MHEVLIRAINYLFNSLVCKYVKSISLMYLCMYVCIVWQFVQSVKSTYIAV